jgi:hypothetical protein
LIWSVWRFPIAKLERIFMSPVGHRFAAGKFADEVVFLHRRKSGKWDHLIGFARPTTAP